jgi:hypothetical protein
MLTAVLPDRVVDVLEGLQVLSGVSLELINRKTWKVDLCIPLHVLHQLFVELQRLCLLLTFQLTQVGKSFKAGIHPSRQGLPSSYFLFNPSHFQPV